MAKAANDRQTSLAGGKGTSKQATQGGKDRKTASGERNKAGSQGDEGARASDQKRGVVSPQAHSDHDSALPEGGRDRDSGAGAAGGHDSSVDTASRNAQSGRRR